MKTTINIKALRLNNFKGIHSLEIKFNDQTDIYGANTAGKTSVSDAWHWLLTGKDSLDREKFNIKNTANTLLNKANHEVEADIIVNGEPMTLKRVLRENWVKPKGQIQSELKGHVQEFFINLVPMQAGEYQKRINDIISDSLLKMLTNPYYFNRLKWQDQRAVLFNMAGNISDKDIAATKPEFAKLLDSLNNKPLIDYKKQIAAEKKLAKDSLEKIPVQIAELTRMMPEEVNYSEIEQAINERNNTIADIDLLINDASEAYNQKNSQNTETRAQIQKLESDLFNIENGIRRAESNKESDRLGKIRQVDNSIQFVNADLKSKNNLLASTKERITRLSNEKAELLQKFHAKNSEVLKFDEHVFNCPTCLRSFEPGDIERKQIELRENFTTEKNRALTEINAKGKAISLEIKEAEELTETLTGQIEGLNSELKKYQGEADALQTPEIKQHVNDIITADKEVISTKQAINELKAKLADVTPADTTELKARKAIVVAEISELQTKLAGKDQREKMLNRIEQLKKEEAELSQKIADYEGLEFTIAEFDRAKVEETEKRINGLFSLVKFKMYDYTLDGNPIETCQAMIGDVPYNDLNTAAKVQAGLDIINALSTYYQVEAPIFLDNRESVSEIPKSNLQIINLYVSPNDKVLRVA